jgi:hypothetical protein
MDPTTEAAIDRLPLTDGEKRRIRITLSCRDADGIPKVVGAGATVGSAGRGYQLMHNGVKAEIDGYSGPWLTALIRLSNGHHEPQAERAFHELVRHLQTGRRPLTIGQLGSYWSYYSLWARQALGGVVNHIVEPDVNRLATGLRNFSLNGWTAEAHRYRVARASAAPAPFRCESDGVTRLVPAMSVDHLSGWNGLSIDLLIADVRGTEMEMLEGARNTIASGRVRFLFLATHHHSISGDPLTHQRCLRFVTEHHGHVIAEHNVIESFSGDGLIVASFHERDRSIAPLTISRNHPSNSHFRELEYDLSETLEALAAEQDLRRELQDRLQALEQQRGRPVPSGVG